MTCLKPKGSAGTAKGCMQNRLRYDEWAVPKRYGAQRFVKTGKLLPHNIITFSSIHDSLRDSEAAASYRCIYFYLFISKQRQPSAENCRVTIPFQEGWNGIMETCSYRCIYFYLFMHYLADVCTPSYRRRISSFSVMAPWTLLSNGGRVRTHYMSQQKTILQIVFL
mgnify:CR=1 FL=1